MDRVERTRDGRVVHVVTADETAAACLVCGVFSTSVKQRRTTRPRDLRYGEEPLVVRRHKRQFRCRERGCPTQAARVTTGAFVLALLGALVAIDTG